MSPRFGEQPVTKLPECCPQNLAVTGHTVASQTTRYINYCAFGCFLLV